MSRNDHLSLKTYNRIAAIVVGALILGGGGWAAVASLSSAVVAPGSVIVSGKSKLVQHREGGVIVELKVKEGDRVAAGDLVARLSDTQPKAELAIQTQQLHTLTARLLRLTAERRGATEMGELRTYDLFTSERALAEALASEQMQFDARRQSREGQKRQFIERIVQVEEQIEGRRRQLEARSREIATVRKEADDLRPLRQRGLVTVTRINTIDRTLFSLEGEEGSIRAQIAGGRAQIEEIRTQIGNVDREHLAEVAREFRDTEDKLAEVREKIVASADRLAKTEIRAPSSGTVHQLTAVTIGGVVAAGETLMQIVPEKSRLTIEARIERGDIDRVWTKQPVRVRLNSFDRRTTPELNGSVERIAADVETDAKTNGYYYKVEIDLAHSEIERLGKGASLRPGIPAEVYIQTGDRTPFEYFVKPLKDQLARSFKER